MGWKDNAIEVKDQAIEPTNASWKDRAEVEQHTPEEDGFVRSASDAAIGAGQGVTLGGADEIMGALQATGDVVGGDTKLQDWVTQYRKHQQEQQQAFEDAKQRSPVLTTAGEVAGGLALPMGAIGLGTKGLGLAGKAAVMGGAGALAGGLSSKGTLEDSPSQIGKDAFTGGAIGAVAGPAIEGLTGLAGQGLSKLGEKTGLTAAMENYPTLRQSKLAFQSGISGTPVLGDKGGALADQKLKTAASSLDQPLNKAREFVKQKYNEILGQAKGLEVTPDLANDLDKAKKMINYQKINSGMAAGDLPSSEMVLNAEGKLIPKIFPGMEQEIEQRIDNALRTGIIDAQDLKEIQKWARDSQGGLNSQTADRFYDSLNNTANNILKNKVPGYNKVNGLFGDVEDTLSSFKKNVSVDQLDIGGKKATGEQLIKKSEDIIGKAALPFDTGKKQLSQLNALGDNLKMLETQTPDLLRHMGISNVDDFINAAKKASDFQAMSKTIRSTGQFGQSGFSVGGLSRAGVQTGGVLVGSSIKKMSDMGTKLATMPAEGLSMLVQKLSSNPSTRHMGEGLANAIAAKPGSSTKNAVIFTILQNPNSRKAAQELFGEGQEEK